MNSFIIRIIFQSQISFIMSFKSFNLTLAYDSQSVLSLLFLLFILIETNSKNNTK